ncbi:MAG: hypothetical protein E6K68_11140 [Nitrospirae bacterium]|nr:MAG: hypothetical protein E6K68_11140 [Nitrospirota bacterium]
MFSGTRSLASHLCRALLGACVVTVLCPLVPAFGQASSAAPSTYAGYTGTDPKPIPPAPVLGPANSVLNDPTFGSRILRVTDENTAAGQSFISADAGFVRTFNANSTAIKLTGPQGQEYWLEFTPSTFKVGDGSAHPVPHQVLPNGRWEWSAVDPDRIYFLNDTQLAMYNKATGAITNLGGPPNGDPVTYHATVVGLDNWVCSAAGAGEQDSYTEIFCIDPSHPSNSKFINVPQKTINGVVQSDPNWPTSAAGQTIGIHSLYGSAGGAWLGVTFHQQSWGANGDAVFNLATNTWQEVTDADGHGSGHVSLGNGKFVNASGSIDGTDSRGAVVRDPNDLMNSSKYVFIMQPPTTVSWHDSEHSSWFNSVSNPNAPILFSRYTETIPLPWLTWTGEIILAATDGSNTVRRIAHNHNGGTTGTYYSEAFAQISSDGQWALFSSPWDGTLGASSTGLFDYPGRIDTFIVELAQIPPPVSIIAPAAGATVAGTVTVSASPTDSVGVVGIQFQLDGANLGAELTAAPYVLSWNTTTASDGAHTLMAVPRDAAGNTATAAVVSVTVDNTVPTISMSSPNPAATFAGTVTVAASATDNVGVVGVQFKRDGVNLGAEVTAAPYAVSWNTTTASDGAHTLTAVARDSAGNTATAAAVSVTVDNSPPTVAIASPTPGATVSGTVVVLANATDNVGVVGLQFKLNGVNLGAEVPAAAYAVWWNTTRVSDGAHTLTAVARDASGNTATAPAITVTVSNALPSLTGDDVFVSMDADVNGIVQWRNPDGSLRQVLTGNSSGQASSVAFDAARNLYVPHWCFNSNCFLPNNTVERWDPNGNLLGTFGRTVNGTNPYNCNPSSLAFDAAGNVYVGQADCTGDILKFDAAGTLVESFDVLTTVRGTDHLDLASDDCTIFYTSRDKNIYRYNVCTRTQISGLLNPFNSQPLPGEAAFHLKVLPDGGVLVADSQFIVRLDASGNQIQTYVAPGEFNLWGGLDLVGDGTFWASNAGTANIVRFDLQSGAVLARFNTGTGSNNLAGVGVRPPADTPPPSVTVTAPAASSPIAGTVTVAASATDNVRVVGVQFQLDGAPLGAEVTTAPYALSWNTTTASNGAHTLTAVARDAAGNTTTSAGVTVDNAPPAISLSSPNGGATVAGTVSVSASATDNVGVVGVQFQLDGTNLGAEVTTAPHSVSWNTTLSSDGSHSLTAVARDAAGNTATAAAVSVTVDNAPPVLSSVSASGLTASAATISWTTDEASDSQVEYGLTPAYGSATVLNASLVTAHSQAVSGLSASTLYHYRVKSRDGAGNLAVSGDFTVTTLAPPDTTPPTVSLTAPTAGATVAGTVSVSASATDNVGVVGVQFQLEGVNLGAEVTAAPYAVSWNTGEQWRAYPDRGRARCRREHHHRGGGQCDGGQRATDDLPIIAQCGRDGRGHRLGLGQCHRQCGRRGGAV